MAVRPVFAVKESAPFYAVEHVSFEWNVGFAKVQKQKNMKALHLNYNLRFPDKKVLEISSKSMQDHGEELSAFFLKKYVPELKKSIPVECVFQAGKVFRNGGPYKDLMGLSPREAKRDERLKMSGPLTAFTFDGKMFPLEPKTIFYDYIYIHALLENETLVSEVLKYDAFTDIEFNPDKSINCQAKAAATFVSLFRMGLIDKVRDFESFLGLYGISKPVRPVEKPKAPSATVEVGTQIRHKIYGMGKVIEVSGTTLTIDFPTVGMKKLGLQWCLTNCLQM